eukprot:TRINITY_DN49336_c0_g1_i1.p1 TRINITY_DN49336_c0_g1~~TRINITY_DN49336_c0_g1_i1.p1  ORF type:complete len:585 (-),score=61.00 TRINITY_DN49336_c0_g1_i1:270-1994(-)
MTVAVPRPLKAPFAISCDGSHAEVVETSGVDDLGLGNRETELMIESALSWASALEQLGVDVEGCLNETLHEPTVHGAVELRVELNDTWGSIGCLAADDCQTPPREETDAKVELDETFASLLETLQAATKTEDSKNIDIAQQLSCSCGHHESSGDAAVDAEDALAVAAELSGVLVSNGFPVAPAPLDATLPFEDQCVCPASVTDDSRLPSVGTGCRDVQGDPHPPTGEIVVSLVSVNPKASPSFDIARGPRVEVLPELPVSSARVPTMHVGCGRDSRSALVLSDSRVSLRHFLLRVRLSDDSGVVLDLLDTSSNGTWVNGERVARARWMPLMIGDRISVLTAAQVGWASEIAFLLLFDTRGAKCADELTVDAAETRCCEGPKIGIAAQCRQSNVKSVKHAGSVCQPLPSALERDLRCGICMEGIHKCLMLIPCGHNFCAACLGRWRMGANACPECREVMRQAVWNPTVDSMVETFSKVHPSTLRPAVERVAMDMALKDIRIQRGLRWLVRDKKTGIPLEYAFPPARSSSPRGAAVVRARGRAMSSAPAPPPVQEPPVLCQQRQVRRAPSTACVIS